MTAQVYTYENIHSLSSIFKASILCSMFIISQLKMILVSKFKNMFQSGIWRHMRKKKILNRGAGHLTTHLVHINAYNK